MEIIDNINHLLGDNLKRAITPSSNLESRVNKEKQFNRKVELNAQLRKVKNELEKL